MDQLRNQKVKKKNHTDRNATKYGPIKQLKGNKKTHTDR